MTKGGKAPLDLSSAGERVPGLSVLCLLNRASVFLHSSTCLILETFQLKQFVLSSAPWSLPRETFIWGVFGDLNNLFFFVFLALFLGFQH